jgi:hypothetical protein
MINADRFRLGRTPQSGNHTADAAWGSIFYRGALAFAVLILVLALGNWVYNVSQSRPLIPLIPFIVAGAIWLIGCVVRYLFTDR